MLMRTASLPPAARQFCRNTRSKDERPTISGTCAGRGELHGSTSGRSLARRTDGGVRVARPKRVGGQHPPQPGAARASGPRSLRPCRGRRRPGTGADPGRPADPDRRAVGAPPKATARTPSSPTCSPQTSSRGRPPTEPARFGRADRRSTVPLISAAVAVERMRGAADGSCAGCAPLHLTRPRLGTMTIGTSRRSHGSPRGSSPSPARRSEWLTRPSPRRRWSRSRRTRSLPRGWRSLRDARGRRGGP